MAITIAISNIYAYPEAATADTYYPGIPESSSPFFLMKLKGNISKCNGCQRNFQKTSQFPDSIAVMGHSEMHLYPYLYLHGSRGWKLGREQRKYYHLNLACHPITFPWQLQQPFPTSMLTQRLSPQIPTTQQISFSGIRLLQPSVPKGFPYRQNLPFQNLPALSF